MNGSSPKSSLSATNVAEYHHLDCDLFLHNVYNASGHPPNGMTPSSGDSKPRFEKGNVWESTLLAWLDAEGLLLTVHSSPLESNDIKEIVDLDERDQFYIAGLTFYPPKKALVNEFVKMGTTPVNFGLAKPDLLEIKRTQDGSVVWTVIDAKASKDVKTSHHAQIFFYTLCLQHHLPASFRSSGIAAVWLPPLSGIELKDPSFHDLKPVSVSLLSDSLKNLLFRRIPQILSIQREHVTWHYNPLCRDCPFNSDCRTRVFREGSLGSMPNISHQEVKNLRELLAISDSRSDDLTDIEDLHKLVANQRRFEYLEKSFPSTVKEAKRILGLSIGNNRAPYSALVEAAKTSSVQVIHRRSFTCPRSEDIAIIISILQSPGSAEIVAFCLSVFTTLHSFDPPEPIYGSREELVSSLASVLQIILGLNSTLDANPRTQCYVFSLGEHAALQRHLVNAALTLNPLELQAQTDIRLCIGALSEGASLLSTSFQPLILSGALLDFLGKKSQRSKAELKLCLRRLNLLTEGTVEQLRVRIHNELQRLKREGGRMSINERSLELGQLPRIVIIKSEVERLLALPIPGYWDLPECASTLLPVNPSCPSDDDLFFLYKNGTAQQLGTTLERRNQCIYEVIRNLRTRVSSISTKRPELLVNEARVLSANFMDICQEESLRKLFFMQQFEVLAKLNDLWRSRIDGCPDAPILEYRSSELRTTGVAVHSFNLISGILDSPTDKDRAFYSYLLVDDDDGDDSAVDLDCAIPVEALFDDLSVCGVIFPLNRYTKERWNTQHSHVQNKLLIADLRDIVIERQRTKVTLHTWGSCNVKLVTGRQYRLSPRLVDFNVTKVLSTLLEFDFRCGASPLAESTDQSVPFLQLISTPHTLMNKGTEEMLNILKTEASIQELFQELDSLGSEPAGALVLKSSQRCAARRILSNRLAVIWGPPGTGKTYTLALSLLRLLDVQARIGNSERQIIFITAMTHAAVQACLCKLSYLMSCYRQIESLPVTWLDNVNVEHVMKGSEHFGPNAQSQHVYIYVGTVYQLFNFSKRFSFEVDCVIIDEAGQLALGYAALVLRSLSPTGRIIVAGDSEQLAPILSAQYPQSTIPLFGSILECLMSKGREGNISGNHSSPTSAAELSVSVSTDTIVQLCENFRLNPDLAEFVSTIYESPFRPQKVQARQLAARLRSITSEETGNDVLHDVQMFLLALSNVMLRQPQTLLTPPRCAGVEVSSHGPTEPQSLNLGGMPRAISLTLVRLQTHASRPEQMSYEAHVHGEAAVAAAFVRSIRQCSPEDDIFVAAPHRIQRQAVKAALELDEHDTNQLIHLMNDMTLSAVEPQRHKLDGMVTVDTVERLQGSEAAFVICLFSLPSSSRSTPSTSELGFLLERRRLNVAISRTKTLCILITSDEVLRPSVRVLANVESAKGYSFLRAFEDRAWSGTLNVNLDNF